MPILPLLLAILAVGFAVVAAGPPVNPRPAASVEVLKTARE